MANYALLEWPENIDIGMTPPEAYLPKIQARFKDQDDIWRKMHTDHALPKNWQTMAYPDFLVERRRLMAGVIRNGFESLE